MKTIYLLAIWLFLAAVSLTAQNITGTVSGTLADGKTEPLTGANVFWKGTQTGSVTDIHGRFTISVPPSWPYELIVSFVGYTSDTLLVKNARERPGILLQASKALEGVEISERISNSFVSRLDAINTRVITTGELQRAACCNLSESFETSASVDVNYSDAISGAKQIKLLGLDGKYSQLQTENIPNLRGLGATFGLNYIPGPWMESIQVSKGTASVKNGYESTTGQINVEYKKPSNEEKLHLNVFYDSEQRMEANANIRKKLTPELGTMLLLHADYQDHMIDGNGDGFADIPLSRQFNAINRWEYERPGERHMQFGVKALHEDRESGQVHLHDDAGFPNDSIYHIQINARRYEFFTKNGFISQRRAATSFGIIGSAIYHEQKSHYGQRGFDATHTSGYLNAVYESYVFDTRHKVKAGGSLVYDLYDEVYMNKDMEREEVVPGIFGEYAYCFTDSLTIMGGIRADFHNLFGTLITPRFHFRYNPFGQFIVRASAGKGYRTPYLVTENAWILASARELRILEKPEIEHAWNYGVNITYFFPVFGREMRLTLDAYRTDFLNQLIVDLDRSTQYIDVYNLDGKSYANSLQFEAQYEVLRNLDITAAFRINDVKTTTNGALQRQLLVNRYKALLTSSWRSAMRKYQLDFTAQFNGDARLPSTSGNPVAYQRASTSPAHTIFHLQASRFFKVWSIYIGAENLTDYKQKDPIIAADQPFGPYFDAASIWGPIHGRKLYIGLRYTLK